MPDSMVSAAELPKCRVQWWDAYNICVLCPFCHGIHHHSFHGAPCQGIPSPYMLGPHLCRVAHCDHVRNGKVKLSRYRVAFPTDSTSGNIIYEIDKPNVRFIAGGALPVDDKLDDDKIERLRASFSATIEVKRRWSEAIETQVILDDFCVPRIDMVVSEMVQGNIECVRTFLDTSVDSQTFLHGVESWEVLHNDSSDEAHRGTRTTRSIFGSSGKTALHLAACERFPEMVRLLLSRGAAVDAVDVDGRTALMEAALWGRLDNVQVLLEYGADRTQRCVDQNHTRIAIDFAKPLSHNAAERWRRSGGEHRIYREDTYQRDTDRQEIICLLRGAGNEPPLPELDRFSYQPSCGGTSLTLVTQYSIPNAKKTVACMYRTSGLPLISAMSGWSHMPNENIQVAGRDWTSEVFRLCKLVQFSPAAHVYDRGIVGQFNACHAEKQLIAYFIYRHLFLPGEVEVPSKLKQPEDVWETLRRLHLGEVTYEESQMRDQERDERNQQRIAKMKLFELRSASPPGTLRKALILSSRLVCADCRLFAKRVNLMLQLDLELRHSCTDSECEVCQK